MTTDLNTLTKAAINALLVTPLTVSQLKKTSHAELVAMFDAMSATDALDADLRDARADDTPPTPEYAAFLDRRAAALDVELAVDLEPTPPTDGDMIRDESNHFGTDPDAQVLDNSEWLTPTLGQIADATDNTPAPTPRHKPGGDVILFFPADSQKEPRAGTKRATIIDLLRAPQGTTVEAIAAATGWARSVAQSALYVDVKGSGFGVERKDGRLHLLPQGAK